MENKKVSFTYPEGFDEVASRIRSLATGATLSGSFNEDDAVSLESKKAYLAGFISSIILM